MKKIVYVIAVAVLALSCISCNKAENKYSDTVVYTAMTSTSGKEFKDRSLEELYSCQDYFDKLQGPNVLGEEKIKAEGATYEEFQRNADAVAATFVKAYKEKGMAVWTGVENDMNTKDLGSGFYTTSFKYSFGAPGRVVDSFEKKISYDGGFRAKTGEVKVDLKGKTFYSEATFVMYNGVDEKATLTVKDIKVCLPDCKYMDKDVYGDLVKVTAITFDEKAFAYKVDLSISIDETKMAAFKAYAGDWYALVFFDVAEEKANTYVAKIPIKIVK